jgi:hypothetical protein
MLKIGLVPLDSRPCNTTWLSDFGSISGEQITMFPREKCGTLERGADAKEILVWLEQNFAKFDALILSTDAFCFGGLIQAREGRGNLDLINQNIDKIVQLKKAYPQVKIYLFDTLMRTSISAHNELEAKYWQKVNEYSKYYGLSFFQDSIDNKAKLAKLVEEIPPSILETYHHARCIKHQLNRTFIDLVQKGVADFMILLQEDSMPYGIQQVEQMDLKKHIEENKLGSKIRFYNGTDEGGLVLLSKILNEAHPTTKKVQLLTSCPELMTRSHLFEDRPFEENLYKMAATIGVEFSEESDVVLAIFSEKNNEDLDLAHDTILNFEENNENLAFCETVNDFLMRGKKVVLVDLQFPNGGNPLLLTRIHYPLLAGYSAWNTSSNSLGSAFAQIIMILQGKDNVLNKKFTFERMLDDCVYQTLVRRKVNEDLIEQKINVYQLKEMNDYACQLISVEFNQRQNLFEGLPFTFTLPWKRTFEIELTISEENLTQWLKRRG